MSPDDYFEMVEARQMGGSDLPEWDGESPLFSNAQGYSQMDDGMGYEPRQCHIASQQARHRIMTVVGPL